MAYLYQHLKTDTWAYFSTKPKVTPNTFVTNSERQFYVGGPGIKAAYKIAGVRVGTRVTVDMEEYNQELGYHRVFKFPDIGALIPTATTEFLRLKYPGAPEEWELWMDRSGLSEWIDPVPVEPEPEPEPIDPEPEPPAPVVGKRKFIITLEVEEVTE